MQLCRTKCSKIITNVIAATETTETVNNIKRNKLRVLLDESTDISTKKNLCVAVRYADAEREEIRTELFELIELDARECNAEHLYKVFKNKLMNRGIPLENIIGHASDGASVMVGEHNSILSRLFEDTKTLVNLRCICHSASTEELLGSIYNYTSKSAKRCAQIQDMQEFHSVERTLEHYTALTEYFKLAVFEDKLKQAKLIYDYLQNECNKAVLYFFKYALNFITAFNALFQSREILIHNLQTKSLNL